MMRSWPGVLLVASLWSNSVHSQTDHPPTAEDEAPSNGSQPEARRFLSPIYFRNEPTVVIKPFVPKDCQLPYAIVRRFRVSQRSLPAAQQLYAFSPDNCTLFFATCQVNQRRGETTLVDGERSICCNHRGLNFQSGESILIEEKCAKLTCAKAVWEMESVHEGSDCCQVEGNLVPDGWNAESTSGENITCQAGQLLKTSELGQCVEQGIQGACRSFRGGQPAHFCALREAFIPLLHLKREFQPLIRGSNVHYWGPSKHSTVILTPDDPRGLAMEQILSTLLTTTAFQTVTRAHYNERSVWIKDNDRRVNSTLEHVVGAVMDWHHRGAEHKGANQSLGSAAHLIAALKDMTSQRFDGSNVNLILIVTQPWRNGQAILQNLQDLQRSIWMSNVIVVDLAGQHLLGKIASKDSLGNTMYYQISQESFRELWRNSNHEYLTAWARCHMSTIRNDPELLALGSFLGQSPYPVPPLPRAYSIERQNSATVISYPPPPSRHHPIRVRPCSKATVFSQTRGWVVKRIVRCSRLDKFIDREGAHPQVYSRHAEASQDEAMPVDPVLEDIPLGVDAEMAKFLKDHDVESGSEDNEYVENETKSEEAKPTSIEEEDPAYRDTYNMY